MACSRRSTFVPTVQRQLGARHPLLRPAATAGPKQLRSRSVIVLSTPIYNNHRRIHDACLEHGVAEPVIQVSTDWVIVTFPRREVAVAPHVTPHVRRLVAALQGETGRVELMAALGLADRSHFLRTYLHPSLDAGLIEMTQPQSPRSRNQRYRLTVLGGEARRSRQESEEEGITERTRRP